jgi:hypothetical protein
MLRKAFRTRQSGTGGRPQLIIWPELAIAQVVKQYAGRAVRGTIHRLVQGSVEVFVTLLLEYAGLSGAQHGVYRAAEWQVPQPLGGLGPAYTLRSPPCDNRRAGQVSGRDGLQLLL